MKYLTKHLTEAAYEAAASNLAKPHVALTVDDNKVHYMPNTTPSHIEGEFYYKYIDSLYLVCLVDWNGKVLWAAVDGNPNAACALALTDLDNSPYIYITWVNQRDSSFTDSPIGTVSSDEIEQLDGAVYENHTFTYFYDEETGNSGLRCTPNFIGEW